MKDKLKKFFRENGYAAIIYCCVALVVVMAAGVALFDSSANRFEGEITKGVSDYDDYNKAVNNSKDKSYTEKTTEAAAGLKTAEKPTEAVTERTAEATTKAATTDNGKTAEKPTEAATENKTAYADGLFAFDEGSQEMLIPVEGKIVMGYSPEVAVFDPTLEQYRTNDTICIAGEIGTPVSASADGVVYDAGYDDINGNYIVIDHGNGWMSTYSQLEDNYPVAVGDIVNAGQVVASIGEPTDFESAMGPHLEFYLTHNNESADPNLVFESVE